MKYKRLTAQGDDVSFYDRTIEECERDYYRLKEYEDKIENGTLVELPCKVGDAVYIIAKQGLDIYTVEKVVVCDFWYSSIFNDLCPMTADGVPLSEIFLNQAEAEKRLEELRGER